MVDVTSDTSALNAIDATIGTPFNQTQIRTLPFQGNNVFSLLSLQAGVLSLGDHATTTMDSDSVQRCLRLSRLGHQGTQQRSPHRRTIVRWLGWLPVRRTKDIRCRRTRRWRHGKRRRRRSTSIWEKNWKNSQRPRRNNLPTSLRARHRSTWWLPGG
jgi:hypothetical protein